MLNLPWIYWILLAVCLVACIQATVGLVSGARFIAYVSRMVRAAEQLRNASGLFKFQPRVTVILPCCGVDERLHQTIERLGAQNYEHYEVIFTFESAEDPAFAAVERWTATWPEGNGHIRPSGQRSSATSPHHRRVIAGLTPNRSQKIHNLLAAVAEVSDDCEVLVFLDSDAVPDADWLGHIVAPLADTNDFTGTPATASSAPPCGASTGFRWYCAAGGWANAARCVWNAASITLMENDATRFCWGGATAIRRSRFEELRITDRWAGALSDDLQVTQAIKEAGLRIVFVPQALIPSHDVTSFAGFWEFARRQLIITRICAPEIWRAGLLLCLSFVGGGALAGALCIGSLLGPHLGWFDPPRISLGPLGEHPLALIAGILWVYIALAAMGRTALRQVAIRKVLHPPNLTLRDAFLDITGALWSGVLHIGLFLASARGRRIRWRHTEYELVSPTQTRVIRRWSPDTSEPLKKIPAPAATAAT